MHDALVAEIDRFITGYKTLVGYRPEWSRRSYGNEWQVRWGVEDDTGTQRGELCISVDLALMRPSIVAIYEGKLIYRIDVLHDNASEENPLGAQAIGLPRRVYGSHEHSWTHNKEWCRTNGFGELPFRSSPGQPVNNLDRALEVLAQSLNITIMPGQRGIEMPAPTMI